MVSHFGKTQKQGKKGKLEYAQPIQLYWFQLTERTTASQPGQGPGN